MASTTWTRTVGSEEYLRVAQEFFEEILSAAQVSVLTALAEAVTSQSFYMAGRTALASQLGHRRSLDFDWFRTEAIPDPLQLASELRRGAEQLEVTGTSSNTLHGELQGVRLSWFSYRYPSLEPHSTWEEYGCLLASIRDIGHVLMSLTWFEDAEADPAPLLGCDDDWASVKSAITGWVERL